MAVHSKKYVCTLALQQRCFEPCHHMRPHKAMFGCDYKTCLDEQRSCIPYVGKFDFWDMPEQEGDARSGTKP